MAKELEIKIINIDVEKLEKKLQSIGAILTKREEQINTIYDYHDGSFEKKEKGYIRIRESKNLENKNIETYLTVKKVIGSDGIKEYEEIETKCDDKKSLERILNCFKLYEKHKGKKLRTEYIISDINYHIDEWDKETIPYPYLEIEVKRKEDLKEALSLIGYSSKDICLKTIKELKEESKNRR